MQDDIVVEAEELLAGTFTPEPWEVYREDAGPDTFDGYRVWHDDGEPGTLIVAADIWQGQDEVLDEAKFIAASPRLVRQLSEELKEARRKIEVAEGFLGRDLIVSDWPAMPDNVSRFISFRGVCRTCLAQGRIPAAANWVSCPTGGWWSHMEHPDDEHEADIGWQPEQDMDDSGHYYTVDS